MPGDEYQQGGMNKSILVHVSIDLSEMISQSEYIFLVLHATSPESGGVSEVGVCSVDRRSVLEPDSGPK